MSLDLGIGAAAGPTRSVGAREAARARVRGGDEHEAAGNTSRGLPAHDADAPVLERLAQRLQARARELGELVEEQDAAVGERDLARRRDRSAADEAGRRDRVVGRPERPAPHEPAAGVHAGDRVDARDLERLGARQRRQDRRQAPRQHRLARARRALEQQVVAAGGGDLERAQRPGVAAYVGEVGRRGVGLATRGPGAARGSAGAAAPRSPRPARAGPRCPRPRSRRRARPRAPGRAAGSGRAGRRAARPRPPRARPGSRAAARSARARRRWPSGRGRRPRPARSRRGAQRPSRDRSPGPTFFSHAGARLTVIRRAGNSKPWLPMAERTRSRASRTERSASPTTLNAGRPGRMSVSTVTGTESSPSIAKVEMRASTQRPYGRPCDAWGAKRAESAQRLPSNHHDPHAHGPLDRRLGLRWRGRHPGRPQGLCLLRRPRHDRDHRDHRPEHRRRRRRPGGSARDRSSRRSNP